MGRHFSKTRREMIAAGGRLCQLLGLPRSTGQIYGLLYLSTRPLSLDDLVEQLGISKASASTGTRLLCAWGAIQQVWLAGERRPHFEVVAEVGRLVRGCYTEFIKPRLTSSQRRLESMTSSLDEELAHGLLTPEEHRLCANRLTNLARLQKKLLRIAPVAEKFI
ncbi:MAG: hypothetical protein HY043_14050 [Verrucomicrobia bacterium]|nr:hypothetical protein [Verrucomicrobiota bacterium]